MNSKQKFFVKLEQYNTTTRNFYKHNFKTRENRNKTQTTRIQTLSETNVQ